MKVERGSVILLDNNNVVFICVDYAIDSNNASKIP